jgi:hypothetical protein
MRFAIKKAGMREFEMFSNPTSFGAAHRTENLPRILRGGKTKRASRREARARFEPTC